MTKGRKNINPINHERIRVISGKILFQREDYTVFRAKILGTETNIICTGSFDYIRDGQTLELVGEYINHPKFGRQFKVYSFSAIMPKEGDGILAYLSKGFVKGIGESYAEKLFEKFGNDVLEVIDKTPDRLRSVPGIGKKRQQAIIDAWQKEKGKDQSRRETIMGLLGLGFGQAMSQKLWKLFGAEALPIARRNVYSLITKVRGFGFTMADRIALEMGIQPDEPKRVRAVIIYSLKQAENEGHCFLKIDDIIKFAEEYASLDMELVTNQIDQLILENKLVKSINDSIYTHEMYIVEKSSAEKLSILLKESIQGYPSEKYILNELRKVKGISYTHQQTLAIKGVFQNRISIITGGPGTGKTTTLQAIIAIARNLKWQTLLAAPTGRAAKRASESAEMEAFTIHRMLGYDAYKRDFLYNEDNPIPAKMVIVDEMSMVDSKLFMSLISAIGDETMLIMLGDVDQLESVGAGAVFSELVYKSSLPIFRLTSIIRQKADSMIIHLAHSVIHGEMPELVNKKKGDFFFLEEDNPQKCAEILTELVNKRLPDYYGISTDKIQVLTPMHRGVLGTDSLNRSLRETLNPHNETVSFGGYEFRVNDRVMQTENNYDLEVYNGDWGKVIRIEKGKSDEKSGVIVRFDKDVFYPASQLSQLTLAYAVTIHKSQGSEYPAVVIPISTSHFIMLQRNLLYTAFTRAKRLLVVVGSKRALSMAVSNFRKIERYTNLGSFL